MTFTLQKTDNYSKYRQNICKQACLERNDMDFRHLEYFIEIAKEGNITHAAENLYVSQSAVNQYLLKIEKQLGTPLFIRSRRNLILTPAGEVYLDGCQKALALRQDTYRQISDIIQKNQTSLTVGLSPNRGLSMFTAVYPGLHDQYPELEVIPVEMNAYAQQEACIHGRIDLGLIVLEDTPSQKLETIDLGTEEMIVIVPEEHPVCSVYDAGTEGILPAVDLSFLADSPFIVPREGSSASEHRNVCNHIFENAGFRPNILMETTSTAHIVSMAQACRCCGIVPRYYIKDIDQTMRCYVLPSHPGWHLYLIYRKNAYLLQAAQDYIRAVREYWCTHLIPPQDS